MKMVQKGKNKNNLVIRIQVHGRRIGRYNLITYSNRLRDYTSNRAEQMYILVKKNGKEYRIPVGLIDAENAIYMPYDQYLLYSNFLDYQNIELRKT